MRHLKVHLWIELSYFFSSHSERNSTTLSDGHKLPESEYTFEVKIENDVRQVYRQIQKALTTYKDEKRGK